MKSQPLCVDAVNQGVSHSVTEHKVNFTAPPAEVKITE
jgi:hypothetical protein